MRRIESWFSVVAIASLLFLCSSNEILAEPSARPWRDELPIRSAWLRDHLPDDSLIYLRVPNLIGVLAMPKGTVLDPALRSKANIENIQNIQQGIVDNVLGHIAAFTDLRLRLLQTYLRSPVEVAVSLEPAPSMLMAANLGFTSQGEFTDALYAIGLGNAEFGLIEPLDDRGVGQLGGLGMPMFVRFDADTGLLLLQAGPAITAESFDLTLQATDTAPEHAMRTMENRIDSSGQGLFAWINAERAYPLMQTMLPPGQIAPYAEAGLDKVTAAAMGWGVANGKGRMSIVVDITSVDDRGYLPYVRNELSATSVGDPDALFVLSIPTLEEFSRLESRALSEASPEDVASWLDAKNEARSHMGVSIEELFAAIGPDLLVILDSAGDYAAIRLRDPELWESIVERVSEKADAPLTRRRISGDTYYHLALGAAQDIPDEILSEDASSVMTLLTRQRDHIYWTRDDDYLYVASVPQVLIDRNSMRARTDIGDWLAESQRIDARHAVLSLSGTSRKLPGRLYGIYLEILQFLADVSEVEIDMWAMPTARQLELPELGTLGFTVSLGDPTLSMELTFENNPTEVLGGFGGIAVVGVLAAIAIPAYDDYTTRAQVSEGLNLAGSAKAAVAEHYREYGQFPGAADAQRMSISEPAGTYARTVTVEPDTGVIIIDYTFDVLPDGGQIFLEPTAAGDGSIVWICTASIENKHLPSACRD